MKTAPTNKKVREIITLVKSGKLLPRPEFQRRLVWKIEDKNHFLDSVLNGFPFPEIYVADGDVDLDTGEGTQLLVDGLQRVSTLVQYFSGDEDLKLTTVPLYKSLSDSQKSDFLQYDVAVRDLGAINSDLIVEVFRRINATSYSLTDMEVNNAVYRGKFKEFCEQLSLHSIFTENRVFSALDYRRMGDLRFTIQIVATVITGYFNRDDLFEDFLSRYNDEFPQAGEILYELTNVFDFICECGFERKSRIWRKADLFTAIIEIHLIKFVDQINIQPIDTVEKLSKFYNLVDNASFDQSALASIYYKSALQASNDRLNRVRRGVILNSILRGEDEIVTHHIMEEGGLL